MRRNVGVLRGGVDALRNLDADDNDARMVAVKYRGLLGCFGLLCRCE